VQGRKSKNLALAAVARRIPTVSKMGVQPTSDGIGAAVDSAAVAEPPIVPFWPIPAQSTLRKPGWERLSESMCCAGTHSVLVEFQQAGNGRPVAVPEPCEYRSNQATLHSFRFRLKRFGQSVEG
jgi:hypothetical protein